MDILRKGDENMIVDKIIEEELDKQGVEDEKTRRKLRDDVLLFLYDDGRTRHTDIANLREYIELHANEEKAGDEVNFLRELISNSILGNLTKIEQKDPLPYDYMLEPPYKYRH